MKVGILTFHDGYNHGGFLQVYCLQETLKSLGVDVEIINYRSNNHRWKEYKIILLSGLRRSFGWHIIKTKILNISKILKFRNHIANLLNITHFSNDISKITGKLDFDVVILGSDEIWNFQNPIVGLEPAYFGKGIKAKRIVSYAPSFGQVSLNDDIPEQIIDCLKSLSDISVRDENSTEILRKIGLDAERVLDPTFLHRIYLPDILCSVSDYILIYLNGEPKLDEIEELKLYAKHNSKKLVALSYGKKWCDHSFVNVDIFEWLNLFKNANSIVTNTFHGTIYSILEKKSFCVIDSKAKSNKIDSLLESLDLLNHKNNEYEDIQTILRRKIDYSSVGQLIDEQRERSLRYLAKVTSSEKNYESIN